MTEKNGNNRLAHEPIRQGAQGAQGEQGALSRISAKGLRRPSEIRSFLERTSQPYSSREAAAAMDRSARLASTALTAGLSPVSLALALTDWAAHLAVSPGTLSRLSSEGLTGWVQAMHHAVTCKGVPSNDPRYADEAWAEWPFCALASSHKIAESWWHEATALRGMEHHHEDMMRLFSRQWLDMLAPANWPWSNPKVLKTTWETRGENLLRGAKHAFDDWRQAQGLAPIQDDHPPYRPGIEVACTPGEVVFRNHLIELIQYTPTTPKVQREPLFIVPSWIMKYYILDLSPHNSMVRYMVSKGHTVFMLSWRNPDESDALLDMQDYLQLGVLDALAVITQRCGGVPIHTTGYCLGGTLLAMAAAALARPEGLHAAPIAPLASMTLLAAQLDFRDAGEMGVLLDEAQVALLEDAMAERGFLTGRQMAESFQFLRARDLVWSARMREYLLGVPDVANDLMTWNADVTRMPAVMHSNYLHSLYLHNDFAEGRYEVAGEPVSLGDLRLPIFSVGTLKDHVTPWRSAYKVKRLVHADVTFVLTSGGHNAGVVSEPGHAGRDYQLLLTLANDRRSSPDVWLRKAPHFKGSWWPAWHDWLLSHGKGVVAARKIAAEDSLTAAPGHYVLMRYRD